jgi:hypothetical protein
MDLFAHASYVIGMVARILTLLSVLAIAVVTTAGAAHAGRIAGMPSDHVMHLADMTEAMRDGLAICADDPHCGTADGAICDFVCTGLSVFLTISGPDRADAVGPVRHDLASATCPIGLSPDLTERPPKLRLL